jgi:hypothetical protein
MNALQLGLILNIVGTVLIFFCGFPSKIEPDNSQGSISYAELSEEDNKKRLRKNIIITFGGYFGMALLFIGFFFQFIDTMK